MPVDAGSEIDKSIRASYHFDPMIARQITFLMKPNLSQIRAIPERIKDKVLDWALALESANVKGDGMSFSDKEKEISHNVTFNLYDCQVGQLNNQGTNNQAKE
jgi:hypothetical protein